MIFCAYAAGNPNEIQIAIGGGAGTVQVVAASRVLREEAETLLMDNRQRSLGFPTGGPEPEGRAETGNVGPFEDVSADDVVISVSWRDGEPSTDYCAAKAATADQLLCAAIALDEYARFGIWKSRFQAEMMAGAPSSVSREAAAIVRAARMPAM